MSNAPTIPVPAGATADEWNAITSAIGDTVRSLEWSRHDAAGIGVAVDGWQDSTGQVSRCISLYDTECKELTAEDARQLAAALIEAADELDRLEQSAGTDPR
jgi:hypothetical protein